MNASMRSRPWARLALLLVFAAGGCASPRDQIKVEVTSARPAAAQAPVNGAIFGSRSPMLLFEDHRPHAVGDLLTVQLNETLNASQSATSNTEKKTNASVALPGVKGVIGMGINALNTSASSDNAFNGTGATASSGVFTGTITVTVLEVLSNGNLKVAGEKQIGIRENSEVLRFAGVVDPALIQYGNVISSTQVSDVRLDHRGGGNIEEAQMQGWFGRFFNSWSPF